MIFNHNGTVIHKPPFEAEFPRGYLEALYATDDGRAKLTEWGITWENEPVVEQVIDIDALLANKNAEINAARLQANQTSFTYAGKEFASDPLSRGDIDAMNGMVTLLNALPPGWLGFWKAADNTFLPIEDVATWVEFYGAMVNQGMLNFQHAQWLKAQLQAAYEAGDIAAMQAISWG